MFLSLMGCRMNNLALVSNCLSWDPVSHPLMKEPLFHSKISHLFS